MKTSSLRVLRPPLKMCKEVGPYVNDFGGDIAYSCTDQGSSCIYITGNVYKLKVFCSRYTRLGWRYPLTHLTS